MAALKLDACIKEAASRYGIILKDKQYEAIFNFVLGRDVFVSLPTGYGKSMIYALLPSVFDLYKEQQCSIIICVSPLVALMMDQKAKFAPKGIETEFVGEQQTDLMSIRKVLDGQMQLVYISPENIICNPMYRNMLLSSVYKEKLVGLVVDEAHCVKTWGDSFRVAYAVLGDIRSIISSHVNVMALTATATNETYQTVCQRLSLADPVLVGSEPNRDNITYEVRPVMDMGDFCAGIADNLMTTGVEYPKTVIFCQCYNNCAAIYHTLKAKLGIFLTFPPGYPKLLDNCVVAMYTRATKTENKEKVLSSFSRKGKLRVVVATTAFGMGVDCADIRIIYHWRPPSDLEQYMQETGRAGRDGLPSRAMLINGKPVKSISENMKKYVKNNEICRRKLLLENLLFTKDLDNITGNDNCCDICLESL